MGFDCPKSSCNHFYHVLHAPIAVRWVTLSRNVDKNHWPRRGKNILEVTLTRRDPEVTPQIFLRDVELEIKYLLGKKFYRGQDPDLGDYEFSTDRN